MQPTKYSREQLQEAVSASTSFAGVLRFLGLKQSGGTQALIRKRIAAYEIETTHFKRGWSKGLTCENSDYIAHLTKQRSIPDADLFSNCGVKRGGSYLKRRFLQQGVERVCKICGIAEWLGQPITLHLDHINGVKTDNRLENLRLLCPNCHQQTETWGFRGKKN